MLAVIDASFSQQGRDINDRPLAAASLIVTHFIVAVSGDENKDEFHEKDWFAVLFAVVHKWYRRKYGGLMDQKLEPLLGLIVCRGLPHTIEIPRTISTRQDDGLTKLTFPSRLYESEDPAAWAAPRLPKRLADQERRKIEGRLKFVCDALRKVSVNLLSAGGKDTGVPLMGGSVTEHLSKAASSVRTKAMNNSLALWEIHLACEKTAKSLLSHINIDYPKVHDLNKLNELIPEQSIRTAAARLIRRLPSSSMIIKHRYQQGPVISSNAFFVHYCLALRLCVLYSSRIKVRFDVADASFFLKRPPWFSQLG